eukprot:SAG25_NODE_361_length_9156_cov_9.406647_17_plen_218_part_00
MHVQVVRRCLQSHPELMLTSSEQLPRHFAHVSSLGKQRYVDPEILAAELQRQTQCILCRLGDAAALARERQEAQDSWARERRRKQDAEAKAVKEKAIQAASRGDAAALARLLEAQPSLATCTGLISLYPLGNHAGLRIGSNGGHRYGDHTLLTLACENCHAECVALILAAGADARTRLQYRRRDVMHNLSALHLVLIVVILIVAINSSIVPPLLLLR